MGTSHTIIKKGFEFSVDESEGLFNISIGSGFNSKSDASVNVEICDLTIDQLKEASDRLQEVVNLYYLTPAEADAAYDASPAVPISEKEIESIVEKVNSKDLEDILVDARNYIKNYKNINADQAEEMQLKINLLKSKMPLPYALVLANEFFKCVSYHIRYPNLNSLPTQNAATGIINDLTSELLREHSRETLADDIRRAISKEQ